MKKVIVAALVIVLGLGAWFVFKKRSSGDVEEAPEAKIVGVIRGPLAHSIEASGTVASNLDVEIKCKASGEIISLPFEESDVVTKGTLVLELDPVDEQRNVKKAQVTLSSSRARLEKAKQSLAIAEQDLATSRDRARVTLEASGSKAAEAKDRAERDEELFEKKLVGREELESARTSAVQAAADLEKAHIAIEELKTVEAGLELKRQDVTLAKADLETAQISLDIAQQRLADTKVYAPIDGVITQRNVQEGQIIASATGNVSGGTTVMLISDLSKLYVIAAVDESDIGSIQPGLDVVITADAFPDAQFSGVVERIAPKGKSVSSVVTFQVRIEVGKGGPDGKLAGMMRKRGSGKKGMDAGGDPAEMKKMFEQRMRERGMSEKEIAEKQAQFEEKMKQGGGPGAEGGEPVPARGPRPELKPEMTADVEIIIQAVDNALQVPVEAVSRIDGKQYVKLVTGEEKTEEREVETGITDGVMIEITSGVEEGSKVEIKGGGAASRWSRGGDRGPSSGATDARRTMRMMGPH